TEPEYLDRIGELSAGEIEAIRRKALGTVQHNSCGRRPDKHWTNFIRPDDLCRFAARRGLLTPDERAVLWLDERGEDVGPGGGGTRGGGAGTAKLGKTPEVFDVLRRSRPGSSA